MSYDVTIGEHSYNYTFNVSKLIYDHIPDRGRGGGLHAIAGLTGREAAVILHKAFEALDNTVATMPASRPGYGTGEPDFCAKYDSPNGWGSTVGGILFLGKILGACATNPDNIVIVSM